jgi:hypothetical protein
VQPLTAREMFSNLFSTHPPLSERIAILRNMTITRQGQDHEEMLRARKFCAVCQASGLGHSRPKSA